jgi:restriction endonuclease S subunit
MQKYPAYKDSGVEWLGEIPNHWEVKKVTHVFNKIGSGTTPTAGALKYYDNGQINWLQTGDLNDGLIDDTNKKITKKAITDFSTLKQYPKESIVIAMYGATIGKLGYLNIETTTNQACCVLGNPNTFSSKYGFYSFMNAKTSIISMSYGGGQPNISQDLVKSLRLSVPPLPEQTAIADFLDRKTALIDQAIGIKQKQIELLKERRQILIHKAVTRGLNPNVKMKDSGVEWIGEIPEGWDKSHLKWMSKLFAGGTPDKANLKYWENGTIPWLASGEVNQEIVKYPTTYITNIGFKNSSARWIEKDSLIVALAGQGKTKGMVAYLDISTTGNQSLAAVITNKERLFTKYLFFYLMAAYKELRGVSGEGQRDGLNLQKLGDIDICIPSIEEQINISGFIETASKKIFETISLKEQEIEKLKEYKATLINSAVTGKIKVC